jgi:ankyrin repeat protein
MNFFQIRKIDNPQSEISSNESLDDDRISFQKLFTVVIKSDDDVILLNKLIKKFDKKFCINTKDASGWSLLYYATVWNKIECTRFLLENGANVNNTNNYGYTPLTYAKHAGYTNMITLLMDYGGK